jgi:hypothetical protein
MIRACKALGVALIALLTLAVAAPCSSATPLVIGGAGEAFYSGDQDGSQHEFLYTGLSVRCTTATFEAKSSGTNVNELTLTPSYSGCKADETLTTHVRVNGCTYTLTTPSEVTNTPGVVWKPSDVHLVCPTGKSLELTPTVLGVSACSQIFAAQTATAGQVTGYNSGTASQMDVTLEFTLAKLHYTGTGSICGDGATHSDAEYSGKVTLRAYSDAAHTKQVSATFSLPAPPAFPITGDQDVGRQVYKTPEGNFECTTVIWTAYSESATIGELTVTPHFTGCTVFGFAVSDVRVNDCVYTLTTPTSLGAEGVTWGGEQIHLLCPTGKQIELTPTSLGVSVCTHYIGPQTPTSGHIVGRNKGSGETGMDVTLEITLSGLHYTGTGGSCGNATTHTDASLSGLSTLRGYSDEAHSVQRSITVS